MDCPRISKYVYVAAVTVAAFPFTLRADEVWTLDSGISSMELDADAMARIGLTAEVAADASLPHRTDAGVGLALDPASDLILGVMDGGVTELFGRHVKLVDGITFVSSAGVATVRDLAVVGNDGLTDEALTESMPMLGDVPYLELRRVKFGFDAKAQTFAIFAQHLTVSPSLAAALGDADLAGARIGKIMINVNGTWVGGDAPVIPTGPSPDGAAAMGAIGPDMAFCQLYGLGQYGRLGSVVGLSLATTSWNVGDEVLMWHGLPAVDHPFIVMNLYRLKDDRFEQIGQSWIKHGFCALDSTQCGGSCPPTGCGTLGINCTDTYGAGLNAGQSGLGPRYEVNPWTGVYVHSGSHLAGGGHSHNAVQHRLQVHDDDLNSALNVGATYYGEGYYVCLDDVNVWNSASWKPVTVSGSPGGNWSFGMSNSGTLPEVGFALDAWVGAGQKVFAPEFPVIEFVSPDGRGVVASKATDLGGGQWHYEYAILNVDLDRKVGSYSVPLPEGVTVTNVGFHAVESHDEPYSNTLWSDNVTTDAVTWTTLDNPIRWGTLYNFRFDADKPPAAAATVVGLFEPGTPATLEAGGIAAPATDCNGNNVADSEDVSSGSSPDINTNGIPDECEPPACGNGLLDDFEECDDYNTDAGDGCSVSCAVESGYECSGRPSVCVDIDECATGTDNCDTNATCANTVGGFNCTCDTGFEGDGVTCSPICGDGLVVSGEPCDDGANENGDGCSASCAVEDGFVCSGQPSVCEVDCDGNGMADSQDMANCGGEPACSDCNTNGTLDGCDIASGGSTDGDGNGVPDECDISAPAPPSPEDSLTQTCTLDTECGDAACVAGVCYVAKNRYVSIDPNPSNAGVQTARRISLDLGGGTSHVLGWIGAPIVTPVAGPETSPQLLARIVDFPSRHYRDWSVDDLVQPWVDATLQVGDCETSPQHAYLIQSIAAGSDEANEANYSTPLALGTTPDFGDVIGGESGAPPDGNRNFRDISAIVRGFQSSQTEPKVWLDLQGGTDTPAVPDFSDISFQDITHAVSGFQGGLYPFAAPCACPGQACP